MGGSLDWALIHVNENRLGLKYPAVSKVDLIASSHDVNVGRFVQHNSYRSTIKFKSHLWQLQFIKSLVKLSEQSGTTVEHVVMRAGRRGVVEPGDLGVGVVNETYQLVSMVIGGHPRCDAYAFVTPMQEILADINIHYSNKV